MYLIKTSLTHTTSMAYNTQTHANTPNPVQTILPLWKAHILWGQGQSPPKHVTSPFQIQTQERSWFQSPGTAGSWLPLKFKRKGDLSQTSKQGKLHILPSVLIALWRIRSSLLASYFLANFLHTSTCNTVIVIWKSQYFLLFYVDEVDVSDFLR